MDPAGRYVGVQAQINDEKYHLFNVYGPNIDNQANQAFVRRTSSDKSDEFIFQNPDPF